MFFCPGKRQEDPQEIKAERTFSSLDGSHTISGGNQTYFLRLLLIAVGISIWTVTVPRTEQYGSIKPLHMSSMLYLYWIFFFSLNTSHRILNFFISCYTLRDTNYAEQQRQIYRSSEPHIKKPDKWKHSISSQWNQYYILFNFICNQFGFALEHPSQHAITMFAGFSVIFQKSAKELLVFHMSVTPGIHSDSAKFNGNKGIVIVYCFTGPWTEEFLSKSWHSAAKQLLGPIVVKNTHFDNY